MSHFPKTEDGRETRVLLGDDVVQRGDLVQDEATGELREYTGPVGRFARDHGYPIFRVADDATPKPFIAIAYDNGQLSVSPQVSIDEAIGRVIDGNAKSEEAMDRYAAGLAMFIRNALADMRVLWSHLNVTDSKRDEIYQRLTGLAFTKEHLDV